MKHNLNHTLAQIRTRLWLQSWFDVAVQAVFLGVSAVALLIWSRWFVGLPSWCWLLAPSVTLAFLCTGLLRAPITAVDAGLHLDQSLGLEERAVTFANFLGSDRPFAALLAQDTEACLQQRDRILFQVPLWPDKTRYLALPLALFCAGFLLQPQIDVTSTFDSASSLVASEGEPVTEAALDALQARLEVLRNKMDRTPQEEAELAALETSLQELAARVGAAGGGDGAGSEAAGGEGAGLGESTPGKPVGTTSVEAIQSTLVLRKAESAATGAAESGVLAWQQYARNRGAIPIQYREGLQAYYQALQDKEE